MEKKNSGDLAKKIAYYALIGVFGLVFLCSSLYIGNYLLKSGEANNAYENLEEMRGELTPSRPLPTEPKPPQTDPSTGETLPPATAAPEPTAPGGMLIEQYPFYEMNNDMVGWITIPDTKVNYPVMQTPDRKDYYLKRNFDKMWSDWGAIYANEKADINRPSDNITLYGHHMKDGSMFAGLDKFKKQAFWEEHQYFYFDTLYERHTYKIWAVFKTSANLDQGFPYHNFVDAANEEEFNEFISTVKKLQFYETGYTPVYGEKLLTLSTCEYSLDNGRFVVCAVRVD